MYFHQPQKPRKRNLIKSETTNDLKRTSSSEIGGDLNADEQHTHNVGEDDGGDAGGGVGDLDGLRAVAIEREIKENDADAAEHEHEAGGEAFYDVLPVDAAGHEDDGAHRAGVGVLRRADAGRFHDDVVHDAGDDHKVGEEEEGEDGVGRGEGQGGELEAEPRGAEEAEGEHAEEVEDRIQRRAGGSATGGGGGGRLGRGLRFGSHFAGRVFN